MDKDREKECNVNGFLFGTEDDIETAQQEYSAIQFLNDKTEGKNAETLLSVYNATLERRLFHTPIGYSYMHEMQKKLMQNGIKKEDIRPVPLYQVFNDSYKKEEVKPVRVVAKKKVKNEWKKKFRVSLFVNIILGILVLAFFAISMTANNPNVLNYRYTIENEYAEWEESLNQREQAVREKELLLEKEE